MSIVVWLLALFAYAGFLGWYRNWRGPLLQTEVDEFMRRMETHPRSDDDERARLRAFLEADDGREFLMLNLVRLSPVPVVNPVTGEVEPARRVLDTYTRRFMRALLRKGGHPAFFALPVGGYVDAWGVEPNPGWSMVGMMRYRSRRDLMELVTDPDFADGHAFKHAAVPTTCSFPLGRIRLFCGPRIWVGLVLALAAALTHLLISAGS